MTALTTNKNVDEKRPGLVSYPMAVDITYRGALSKVNAAGYLAPCSAESGAIFAGVAIEKVDNSAGSVGDLDCRVKDEGVFLLNGTGFALTDKGKLVYATDDQLITLTEAANIQVVGRIVAFKSSTAVWVKLMGASNVLGDVIESDEIALAEGSLLLGNSGGKATAIDAKGNTKMLVGNATTVTSVAMSGHATMDNAGAVTLEPDSVDGAEITDDAISAEHLDDGILPSHIVVYAGEMTTAGGDATETINQAGILDSDIVHVTLHTKGSSPQTILTALAITDNITVTFSANPSSDHVMSWSVLRAVA